jgi:hypothetical protein
MIALRFALAVGLLVPMLHAAPGFAGEPARVHAASGEPSYRAPKFYADSQAAAPVTSTAPSAPADFDFFSHQPTLEAFLIDPAIERRTARRRTMLSAHQAAGLTTLALMAATTIVGQLNYNDLYASDAQFTGTYQVAHKGLAYGTTLGFVTTASLSLLAPAPVQRRDAYDAVTVHKVAVTGAALGLISQIALGITMANMMERGELENRDAFGRAHQVIGYTSLGFMAAAATTFVW